MTKIRSLSSIGKRLFQPKNRLRLLGAGFLIAFLILLIKSCSTDSQTATDYYIGQDSRWPGLDLMGKERNMMAFNSDLLATIAKTENLRIHLINGSSKELFSQLEQGILQGVITNLKPDYSNEDRLIFSDPYFLLGPVLIIPSTAPIQGWNEKAKKIIAVPARTPNILKLESDPSIQIKFYDDILRALADLSDRNIDGAVFPALPAHVYTKTFYSQELKIATLPLNDDGLRLAAPKNDAGKLLIEYFNKGLATLKQNGTYQQLIDQWGLVDIEAIEP